MPANESMKEFITGLGNDATSSVLLGPEHRGRGPDEQYLVNVLKGTLPPTTLWQFLLLAHLEVAEHHIQLGGPPSDGCK